MCRSVPQVATESTLLKTSSGPGGHGDVVANLVLVGSGEDDRPHRSKDQERGVGIPARVQNHDVTFADLLAHWHAR